MGGDADLERQTPRTPRPFLTFGTVIGTAVLVISIVIAGPVLHHTNHSQPAPSKAQSSASSQPHAARTIPTPSAPSQSAAASGDLPASFIALEQSTNAEIGLVVVPVGMTGGTLTFGHWTSGPAWSTAKVPLVLAALREQSTPELSDAMIAAITRSDNDAAEEIWASIGDPATAARKVEAMLRETGDPTIVQSKRIRPQFTAFGQTIWSLADQAHFLSRAASDPHNIPVLDLMNRIEEDQRWGIGILPHARFKGGWGPSLAGRYLVRQLGLILRQHGTLAVALAAEPTSGSYDDGVHTLDKLADWISLHIEQLPSGTCT